ncbi:MAG TPA: class I SAM-dependent methyltransferase [Terriglobales bacterium]|nr:class I SAM-dependent methyltransferase [Terriglobales bacterium]
MVPVLGGVTFPLSSTIVILVMGIVALLLARIYRIPYLVMLDIAAPVAAFFTVAQLMLRPADPGESAAALAMLYWLWEEGRRSVQWQRPRGIVIGECLVLRGVLGCIDPPRVAERTYVILAGISSGRFEGVLSILAGAILLAIIVPRFLRTREEHRIVADVSATGESLQPEYMAPTPECPHPELWKMYDSMSAEAEVLDFLKALVITLKPNLVVETGTFMGVSTLAIAEGLKQNGFGRVITVEYDPKVFAKAKERFDASGLASWIDARNHSSLELRVEGTIDLLFSDSDINLREREVRRFLPQISPNGLILIHDASSHQKVVREAALRLEAEGLISVVLVPTPRGLVVAQKRSGRK